MIKRLLCRLFGHDPVFSGMKRSPNTVYTHWQDRKCGRCGEDLDRVIHYINALDPANEDYYR